MTGQFDELEVWLDTWLTTCLQEFLLFKQLVLDIDSRSSGLGVPGRRYSLGGIIGAFRFLSRVNLQPYIFVALTNTPSSAIAEEYFSY